MTVRGMQGPLVAAMKPGPGGHYQVCVLATFHEWLQLQPGCQPKDTVH